MDLVPFSREPCYKTQERVHDGRGGGVMCRKTRRPSLEATSKKKKRERPAGKFYYIVCK